MLNLDFFKTDHGRYYMIVDGIKDFSSRVTIDQSTGEKFVRVSRQTTIDIFSNSTFQELGQFIAQFTVFHSFINEWDAPIFLKVICLGEQSGYVEILIYLNHYNWKNTYSANYLKEVILGLADRRNVGVIINGDDKDEENLFLTLCFHPKNDVSKIDQAIKYAVQEFEDIMNEIQIILARKIKNFTFSVPKEITIALKQYLIYFPEYVEIVKGKKIFFEVRTSDDGINIELGDSKNIAVLNDYFNEFLGFVKSNIEILNPKFEVEISETKKEIFIIGLKQQVHHLKQQIELKNFEIRVLEREVDRYYNLLSLQSEKPQPPIYISNWVSTENRIDIRFEFKQELKKLQSDILELKSLLTEDIPEAIKKELEVIDSELLETKHDILVVDKKPFTRLKRVFDQLTDDNSKFNKTVEKSKKLKISLQKIGKVYNKIAQWLALPIIPTPLLEI